MRIEDCTQTVDGTPIKIYEVVGDKVLGAWEDDCNNLQPIKWNRHTGDFEAGALHDANNFYSKTEASLKLDLSDWKDEIPWDCLVDEIQFVALWNGLWWGHSHTPYPSNRIYDVHGIRGHELLGVKMPTAPDNWKGAVAQRPKERK